MSVSWFEREGPLLNRYELTDSALTVTKCDASAAAVLENNQHRRLSGVVPKSSWCEHALSIPPGHLQRLYAKYPELKCWDTEVRSRAWKKFMASSESKPYRVTDRRQ